MYPILICNDTIFYKQKTKKIVNKKELIDIVAKRSGMTKTETESLVTIALETLVGFGSFEARERKARYGRNPQSGEKLYIPPSRIPTFSVGNFFKNKVNNYFLDNN
jgi:DNA-binding protein HU-beta